MPHYSVMCITTRSAPTSHLVQLFSRISSTLHSSSSLLTRIDHLGLRPLSHRMKAHQKYNFHGRYTRLEVVASPQVMTEVERRLRVDEEVIRFMTLKEKRTRKTSSRIGYVDQLTAEEADEAEDEEDAADPTALASQPAFVDPSTLTSLQSSTAIDYFTAKTLLDCGLLTAADVLALPRHRADPEWDRQRLTAIPVPEPQPSAATPATVEEEGMRERVEVEYAETKLYLDRRRAEAEAAKALELEWRAREDERAVERKAVVDERLLDKRLDKLIVEEKKRLSRLAKEMTEDEERVMRTALWKRLQAALKRKALTRAQPVHIHVQPQPSAPPSEAASSSSTTGKIQLSNA